MGCPGHIYYESSMADATVYQISYKTTRGNERKPVFKSDQDRLNFLNTLRHFNNRYNRICRACCLMDNHCYLLIETPD